MTLKSGDEFDAGELSWKIKREGEMKEREEGGKLKLSRFLSLPQDGDDSL